MQSVLALKLKLSGDDDSDGEEMSVMTGPAASAATAAKAEAEESAEQACNKAATVLEQASKQEQQMKTSLQGASKMAPRLPLESSRGIELNRNTST